MYGLGAYGSMIADRVRVEAYAEALRKSVRKGSVVAEIGTGPGIFAVLACQLGATRVYAIEPSEIIQVAREVAAANGCADKIEFFEELSDRVMLPGRADVIEVNGVPAARVGPGPGDQVSIGVQLRIIDYNRLICPIKTKEFGAVDAREAAHEHGVAAVADCRGILRL